jgi:CRISPR-associated endonuclease Csn1
MEKILGLDLGTNSIGWAIRDLSEKGNQIIDKGILTFDKGVGEGKSGEYPLVQKRTESRGKRRNYQAEKYRKWTLLKALIEQKMCPLSINELNSWQKYTKGIGRKYPQSEKFIQWLRFDFNGDGKPDFEQFGFDKHENHFLFRVLAVSETGHHIQIFHNYPQILGRVFYHLVQRRGFRGRDEEEAKTILQGSKESGTIGVNAIKPFIEKYKTLGAALYYLKKERNERIRKRYNLRVDYENELKEICRVQNISDELYKKLWKAIIWQRPLRSQKGLVGICTFEKNKARCPISHPLYEEFRTWVFINNLKIDLPPEINRLTYIKEKIYPLFYHAAKDFKLSTIIKELKKVNGSLLSKFNSKSDNDTKVISVSLLYQLESLMGADWKDKYGWHETLQNQKKPCAYSFEDIWHVLFTFDSKEKLKEFAIDKLDLNHENAVKFSNIKLQQGYATLSLSAIKKILPYLYLGFIYSDAIYLANLHKVFGEKHYTHEIAEEIVTKIRYEIITKHNNEKNLSNVVNSLISDQLNSEYRFGMDKNYELVDSDKNDIEKKLKDIFGEKTWGDKSKEQKESDIEFVSSRYLEFLRKPITANKGEVFTKQNRLHDKIFDYLQKAYNISSDNKKYLWHPSEQDTYSDAIETNGKKLLGDPQPISRGFKNPMALKTLHELKSLINYLILKEKIDYDTRVVIEIARELNDANKRKAIEKWDNAREKENADYKIKIQEIIDEHKLNINAVNKDILRKYRLWEEQGKRCIYTGKPINCTELFDGTKYDFEHTVPASMSFDNELKNLTIADSNYNREIKQKRLPTECPNYDKDYTYKSVTYTAIKPRLEFIEQKVENLEMLFDEWKKKASDTKEIKDSIIQRRHMIKMDLDYWRKKLETFTCIEYKAGWRNSQLRDTQIITKYAVPYIKTAFSKVDVQRGTVTAAFREIFQVIPKLEKKDRTKHSHHAIDAAVLTLIPQAAIRDKILLKYFEEKDNHTNHIYHEKPREWSNFQTDYILSIEEEVLINFQPKHRTLTKTYKNVRKRGTQQFVKTKLSNGKWQYKLNEQGKKIPLIAKGDTIRGQLHGESSFGMIKLPEFEYNNAKKKFIPTTDGKGNFTLQKDEIGNDRLFVVKKKMILTDFKKIEDLKIIIDPNIRLYLEDEIKQRIESGKTFTEAITEPIWAFGRKNDKNGNPIEPLRHIRAKVAAGIGFLTPQKAIEIHNHDFQSKYEYKQKVYAQNEENPLCLFYEGRFEDKIERSFYNVGLFELSQLRLNKVDNLKQDNYYKKIEIGRGKNKKEIPLISILQSGQKVILYKNSIEELKDLSNKELLRRLFIIYKFNDVGSTRYIYLQNHIEARPDKELGDGDIEVVFDKYQPRLKLRANNFLCAIEGKDFEVKPDGEIVFK